MKELDYLLTSGNTGIIELEGVDAVTNNIREWLNTPMGTVADRPAWGNNLKQFQFIPHSSDLEVAIAMHLSVKLPSDVVGAVISAVDIKFDSMDLMMVTVVANGVLIKEAINAKG